MQRQVVLIITGRVQGVFYRLETQKTAGGLGLGGYVKNNPDGSVTVVAQGPENKLKELIEWCKKGPDGALIEKVTVTWQPCKGLFTGFIVK